MKNASIFSTVLLVFSVLFMSQNANAQWLQSGNSFYTPSVINKVGIGVTSPSYALQVAGTTAITAPAMTSLSSTGSLFLQNTNNYLTMDGNKLQATKASSTFLITANALLLNPYGGSVGIGTSAPAEARFVVEGAIGNTVALFRKTAASRGISVVSDWPGLFFNSYYNGGSKSMAAGYSGVVNFDPDYGRFDFAVTSASATSANATVDLSSTIRMSINKDGNVGIGTTTPASRLEVMGQDGIRSTGFEPFLTLNDNNSNKSARIQSAHGDLVFHKGVNGNYAPQAIIKESGNFLIGTINDFGFKLAVNGSIRAKEIRVNSNWADYVFADEYALRPLSEVETFIKANKHLPEMQSAAEIQENGLDMAATTTKMMAKIEELTLYLIDLKKENDALKTRVGQLEKSKN